MSIKLHTALIVGIETMAGYLTGLLMSEILIRSLIQLGGPFVGPEMAAGAALAIGWPLGIMLGVIVSGLLLMLIYRDLRRWWLPILLVIPVAIGLNTVMVGTHIAFQPGIIYMYRFAVAVISALVFTLLGNRLRLGHWFHREAVQGATTS